MKCLLLLIIAKSPRFTEIAAIWMKARYGNPDVLPNIPPGSNSIEDISKDEAQDIVFSDDW